ncbi:hypothetical protein, partial [Rhodoplanes sp. SY1]|uniref:hypothetical protein n=1 Tax=Rhodoplanes sp. SY1 TaxID=3166646 RepID=UPI0038B420A7
MSDDDRQSELWSMMFSRIAGVMRKYGIEDPFANGDYFVFDENWGPAENKVEINNLALLRPAIIKELQSLLHDVPNWRIIVLVDIREKEGLWPPMGLIIRRDEIIDGLQRDLFPTEFQDL